MFAAMQHRPGGCNSFATFLGDQAPMRTTAIRSQPDDRKFEAIFNIPDSHRLVQVRSKTREGIMSANYWHHDEYGWEGKLAARYESFEERNAATGASRSGWHKYDQSGQLLHVSETLAE
jgi:hypothetical protein